MSETFHGWAAMEQGGTLDFILVTANAPRDWDAYIAALDHLRAGKARHRIVLKR